MKNASATLSGAPRALKLVWNTHKGYTISLAIATILFGFIPTITVWTSKLLIDSVMTAIQEGGKQEFISRVIVLALAQFGLLLISSLLQTQRNISQQALQELTILRLQGLLMQHANRLDLSFFENPRFYDSLQQVQTEVSYRPIAIVEQIFGLVRMLTTFLSMLALIFSLGWLLTLLVLVTPIPNFISNARYGWQAYMISSWNSPDRRKMNYYFDLLTHDKYHKEIKLFGLGDFLTERWNVIASRFFKENQRLIKRWYLAGFLWGSLTTMVASGTYLYVALQVIVGKLTLGDLTLYTQGVGQVQSSLSGLLNGLSGMYENTLYLDHLYKFLDYAPAVQSPVNPRKLELPLKHGLEFRNVSFTYPGNSELALRDVNFHIKPTEAVALVGQNGAGKTTIVKLLTRLYDPDEGQILLDGVDIREYDLANVHRAIGVIFQDYVTYFLSAGDNIGVGRLEEMHNQEKVARSAGMSGADAVVERLPNGYETMLGHWFDGGYQLSGGEWQKVALARAFMRDAEILILDEPTASLDARTEYEIFDRMKELTLGKMAVFISHRFTTVRQADRIFVLENGTICEAGNHADLLSRDGTYAELFKLQAAAYR